MLFINPYIGTNKELPNFSIAYAATHFGTKVIDLNTKPYPKNRFLNYKTDKLGISVQSRSYSEAIRIAKLYKSKYPKVKIFSVNTGIDVQCCYPFISFKNNITFDEPFSDKYPFPNFELFDSFSIFHKNWSKGAWYYPIMTSLGCPFQCVYCAARNRKWVARSAENCFKELKLAKKRWSVKSFEIIDDCFNLNKNRVIEFCELIRKLKLRWICVNGLRADRFDEDIAKAMSESGCIYIAFGVESINSRVLKTIKKGETVNQIENAIDVAKKYFKRVGGYFIIGLPKSSYETDLRSVKWVLKKDINAHFSYYVPFDRGRQNNSQFYGEIAKPVSNQYPKKLQERIYKITDYMRDTNKSNIIKKSINSFKYILLYDTKNMPLHFISGIRRLKTKIERSI